MWISDFGQCISDPASSFYERLYWHRYDDGSWGLLPYSPKGELTSATDGDILGPPVGSGLMPRKSLEDGGVIFL